MFEALPVQIQELARRRFELFCQNAAHPSLKHHRLNDVSARAMRPESYAVYLNMQYRAVYVVQGDTNIWYWIGTHAAYDRLTGG